MNTKRKVSVQIEGRSYALITADDEKYVQGVADDVIAQIKNSAQAEENEGEDDEESDEIIRKMRQQQISLFD